MICLSLIVYAYGHGIQDLSGFQLKDSVKPHILDLPIRGGLIMTCRELLQVLKNQLDAEANIRETEIRMTSIYGDGNTCTAMILVPVEDKTSVIEIKIKKLCVYEGLSMHENHAL